jgi:ATP-dependent Lon protease
LIPEENVKDLTEIPDNIKNKIEIVPVKWIDQVLERALERMPEALPEPVVADAAAQTSTEAATATTVLTH